MPTKRKRSLKTVVGEETYAVWVAMLRALVPDGRTHRLSVMIAGMLQYAYSVADEKPKKEREEDSVEDSLLNAGGYGSPDEAEEAIGDVVKQLFKDAGVEYKRTSARGDHYTITEGIYAEFVSWHDMPWE
jgi:hypothetical protein